MITADGLSESIWLGAERLCNEIMSYELKSATHGWRALGTALSDAAAETLADVSFACTPVDGPTARLRWLAAIHVAGEGMVRVEHLVRTAGWSNHLAPKETDRLISAAKEVGAMLLVLAVMVRNESHGHTTPMRLWRAAG